jgi:C-terminal processing protease CtpA/Prc
MKRTEIWLAVAVAIAAWIAAPAYPAAAQDSAGADAGTQADAQSDTATQSDAGAQSDTGAQADASADAQAAEQSADASASNQSSTGQQSAQASATSDTAAGQSSTQANGSAQATGQAQQGQADSRRPLPAPNQQGDTAQDRDPAAPQIDRSQADQRQPADGRDATADRDVSQDTARDQANQQSRDVQDRMDRDGRDRDRDRRGRRDRTDFRAHIHFGAFANGGLAINSVTRDSVFFHAGLREGDLLVSVDGHPIRSEADFHQWVVYEPGHRVPVVLLRDGRRETVYFVYEENMVDDAVVYDDQPQQPMAQAGAFLGVVFDAQNPDAAIVIAVTPGSPAEQAGLQRGDIIVALNGQEVRSYRDAIGVINSMQPGDRLGIEYSRRVDDQTQAILAGKPAPGARSATLPQREVRGYRGVPQDGPPATETDIEIRRENENRGLLNRQPSQDGRRPLLPRLGN